MRLAISNIAWDVSENEDVVKLLNRFHIDAIDIAPGKYFPDPGKATEAEIVTVKRWWAERGIEITGMQALLFGRAGLNVFGAPEVKDALLEHLAAVCRIAAGLGASRLVFGSPKNRDRSGLSDEQALDEAVGFFQRLGDVALAQGVVMCLEPNPPCYGANFMTSSTETAHVVNSVGHGAIRMQLDTGALTINRESAEAVLADSAHLIGHVHASEPDLVPLGDCGTDHRLLHEALLRYVPHHVVSIEMVATKNEPHLASIERALSRAVKYYRSIPGAAE
ncbi:sugar phosphate isomerase/epimerase family protein [Aromatoleum buckelii]|uniref:TIM barrel protein n=1 Tax=Aromatoleum buckelii TaxID=200254 RepID=A0ABX1N6N4_9RHOO|nr:TIM barrel protein [Aromatoleum buckelii]MCK0512770.1 sugar phosphate isomerase/epimerase [Aromatoleum buckelii]